MWNLAHVDPLQNHFQVETKDVVTLQDKERDFYQHEALHFHLRILYLHGRTFKNHSISAFSTHHQHIRVNFVHLGQEESKQSPLCTSYLHFPILEEEGSHIIADAKEKLCV